ncbi:hypothetical protein H0H93_005111 [Arthromyces matolae]|nr:hypothetical protein H0H93_005111 [Arthromyces matolae]
MDSTLTAPDNCSQPPVELWMLIAWYLGDEEVMRLFTLNRVFYELAMDMRYKAFDLLEADASQYLRKIETLQMFTETAQRVRILTVWPDATWNSITCPQAEVDEEPIIKASTITTPNSNAKLRISRLKTLFANRRFRYSYPLKPIRSTRSFPRSRFLSSDERKALIIGAASNLTCVTQLNINWFQHSNNAPCCPLLANLFPVVGKTLRALSLDIPLTVLDQYLLPTSHFIQLEDLFIRFTVDRGSVRYDAVNRSNMDALAPFINSFSQTLISLSIETYGHLHFSSFFESLEYFPCLKNLSLALPFDYYHLPNPAGFNRLLVRHSPLLRELTLRSRYCCITHMESTIHKVAAGYSRCFQDVSFDDLNICCLGFDPHLKIIPEHMEPFRILSRNVRSLALVGVSLSYVDVAVLLAALGTITLRETLSLCVEVLTPELLTLLAWMCPNLKRLELEIGRLGLDQSHAEVYHENTDPVRVVLFSRF